MMKICDYEAILKTIQTYLKGSNDGKSAVMKPAFHSKAVMFGINADKSLASGGIDNLYKVIDESGQSEAKAHIDILYANENIASVKVVIEDWHGLNFIDLHQLVKIDDEWKIIAKAYHTY